MNRKIDQLFIKIQWFIILIAGIFLLLHGAHQNMDIFHIMQCFLGKRKSYCKCRIYLFSFISSLSNNLVSHQNAVGCDDVIIRYWIYNIKTSQMRCFYIAISFNLLMSISGKVCISSINKLLGYVFVINGAV